MANAAGTEIITPEVAVEQPLHNLQLMDPGVALEARQNPFNRPFNAMFMPAEYATINCCPECFLTNDGGTCFDCDPGLPPATPTLSCTQGNTRGGQASCNVTADVGAVISSWRFTDAGGTTTVNRSSGNSSTTWSGAVVTGGTVKVDVDGATLSSSLTVSPRSSFAFPTVSPTQLTGTNTITCYAGTTTVLQSPPAPNSEEGYSCADQAYSFNFATIADGGPNNGYLYVTNASNTMGSFPTKFEYIVVSDLLSTTSEFYAHQCGTFSASNTSGFIAASQLNQDVFDHEQGTVLSHWTEYRDAQNLSANNIGTVIEAVIGIPGTSTSTFQTNVQNAGDAALARIAQAVSGEPCGGSVNRDSSQACKLCGAINFAPYQSCGTAQPVPFCQ